MIHDLESQSPMTHLIMLERHTQAGVGNDQEVLHIFVAIPIIKNTDWETELEKRSPCVLMESKK